MENDAWPLDHAIGVYLCVDGHQRLVGTARERGDLSRLLRHLADAWDRMVDSGTEDCLGLAQQA